MNKIINVEQATKIADNLGKGAKKIVVVGGCFDILHIGHIEFLKNAKMNGDVLFVLLESDENIKKIKGQNRPINTQVDRAKILEHLDVIDYVIPLPEMKSNKDYDGVVTSIKPAIIAITAGDPGKLNKERQAKEIDGKVVEVSAPIVNKSTTKVIEILNDF